MIPFPIPSILRQGDPLSNAATSTHDFLRNLARRMAEPQSVVIAIGVVCWLIVALLFEDDRHHSVTFIYSGAAENWLRSRPLYGTSGHGFLYFPQFAVLYTPFAYLPPPLGDLVWRAVGMALLVWSLIRWSELFPAGKSRILLHLAVPALMLALNSLRNGQATVAMTALGLLSAHALARGRWNGAALLLVAGLAVKPLTLVLALLACAVYRPMRWRLALGGLILALLPFLLQRPDYVMAQYIGFVHMLRLADQTGHTEWFAHLFGLLGVWGMQVPPVFQQVLRGVAALTTLGICLQIRRRTNDCEASFWLVIAAAIYLMLFSSRTENSTYCVLGPALGMCYADALAVRRQYGSAAFLFLLAIAVTGSYELGKYFTPAHASPIWLAPLATVSFTIYLFVFRYKRAIGFTAPPGSLAADEATGTSRPFAQTATSLASN